MREKPWRGNWLDGRLAVSAGSLDFRGVIDWQRPWMASLRDIGQPLCDSGIDWRAAVDAIASDRALVTSGGQFIKFVAQSELPANRSYEEFIHATGKVPTRENLHDFLNAVIWSSYPRLKARLNGLQAADMIIAQTESVDGTALSPVHRSRLRDALTLFDENAVLVASSDEALFSLLRSHAWAALFVDRRAAFGTCCEVFPFGHAMIEKLVTPYKAITAHAWLVLVEPNFFAQSARAKRAYLDEMVALQVDGSLKSSIFSPLPVLGVPGWWRGQDADFYADRQVFRLQRGFVDDRQ